MDENTIETSLDEGVLTVRINRPEKKNALTQAMYAAMADAVEAAANDPKVRVLLFAGADGAFCAGNDMQDFLKLPRQADHSMPVARFMRNLAALEKPVVAAVNGLAIGIGVTMLLHCDLVYVADNARLQFPFVNIGICPEFASTYLLPRIMGHPRAAELTLFGEPFTAAQALECGLVNAALPSAEVDAHALTQARRLAQKPPGALRTTKKLLKHWNQAEIQDAIRLEAEHFMPMLHEGEAQEAVTAFLQKRKPDFSRFE